MCVLDLQGLTMEQECKTQARRQHPYGRPVLSPVAIEQSQHRLLLIPA